MKRWIAALSLVLASLVCARSRAQDAPPAAPACAEGRERTGGRCCWPQQAWSDARGACTGAPRCPDTLVEHGDECVLPLEDIPSPLDGEEEGPPPAWSIAPGAYHAAVTEPPPLDTDGWPSVATHPDRPSRRATIGRGEDEGLIIAALAVFDIGWAIGWLGTLIDEVALACTDFSTFPGRRVSCGGAAWSLVPFGGALASGLTTPSGASHSLGFGIGFGIASVIFQGIGGIMSIIAFANETTEVVLQPLRLGDSLSASLSFGAEAADAGLTVGLTF